MTPLHERYILRSHLNRVAAEAAMEVLRAAGVGDSTPLEEAATRLPDDHPAVLWFHTLGAGLEYRDAIAERESWPSEEDDARQVLGSIRLAGEA